MELKPKCKEKCTTFLVTNVNNFFGGSGDKGGGVTQKYKRLRIKPHRNKLNQTSETHQGHTILVHRNQQVLPKVVKRFDNVHLFGGDAINTTDGMIDIASAQLSCVKYRRCKRMIIRSFFSFHVISFSNYYYFVEETLQGGVTAGETEIGLRQRQQESWIACLKVTGISQKVGTLQISNDFIITGKEKNFFLKQIIECMIALRTIGTLGTTVGEEEN